MSLAAYRSHRRAAVISSHIVKSCSSPPTDLFRACDAPLTQRSCAGFVWLDESDTSPWKIQSAAVGSKPAEEFSMQPLDTRVGITFEWADKAAPPARRRAHVRWHKPVKRVLLIKKRSDKRVLATAVDIAQWLIDQGIIVIVEENDLPAYRGVTVVGLDVSGTSTNVVDLVVSVGGDGTFLHASRLFRFLECGKTELLPPCLVLGLGSLGFLATVVAAQWRQALETALRGHEQPVPCTLRTRLKCDMRSPDGQSVSVWKALNEAVVQTRGEAMGKLRLHVDGSFVTLVEGDGLIVATATGSTGYSLSCGGPIMSPSVPGTLLTPIAPASLSFRPVIISEMSSVEIVLPAEARVGQANVVLDGRNMGSLERGGKLVVTVSRPIPVINLTSLDRDWFGAITTKLKWNVRDVEQADMDPHHDE